MQKVTINAAFSDKISENYNSQQYSIGLQMEIQVNGQTVEIEHASAKLFELCRKIVIAQKGVNIDTLLNQKTLPDTTVPVDQAAPATAIPTTQPTNNGASKLCTTKQVKYLLELAKKAQFSFDEIRNLPLEFKKPTFEALSSNEASQLIDRLNLKKAA